jgi:hypothetical protein
MVLDEEAMHMYSRWRRHAYDRDEEERADIDQQRIGIAARSYEERCDIDIAACGIRELYELNHHTCI